MSEISPPKKNWRDTFGVIHAMWLAPLAIAALSYNYFQAAPRLVYTLSDPISLPGSKKGEEVQQLSITNVGNAKAENITAKLGRPILSGEFSKFSQADQPQLFAKERVAEANYPLLPPGASFKLIFRVPQKAEAIEPSGVKSSDLKITHNDGKAQDAVADSNSSSSWTSLLLLGLIGVYALVIFWTIAIESAMSRLAIYQLADYTRVAKAKRPWFFVSFFRARWQREKKSQIRGAARGEEYVKKAPQFLDSIALHLLTAPQPEEIEADEWGNIRDAARKTVRSEVDYFLLGDFQEKLDKAASLVALQPDFDKPTWDWLCRAAQKHALEEAERNTLYNRAQFLALSRPKAFNEELWQQIYSAIQESHKSYLKRDLTLSPQPLDKLAKLNLSHLTAQQHEEVTKAAPQQMCFKALDSSRDPHQLTDLIAEGRPQWADDSTWNMLEIKHLTNQNNTQEAARLASLSQQTQQEQQGLAAARAELVSLITTQKLSPQRPTLVGEKEWHDLQILELALFASSGGATVHNNGNIQPSLNSPVAETPTE